MSNHCPVGSVSLTHARRSPSWLSLTGLSHRNRSFFGELTVAGSGRAVSQSLVDRRARGGRWLGRVVALLVRWFRPCSESQSVFAPCAGWQLSSTKSRMTPERVKPAPTKGSRKFADRFLPVVVAGFIGLVAAALVAVWAGMTLDGPEAWLVPTREDASLQKATAVAASVPAPKATSGDKGDDAHRSGDEPNIYKALLSKLRRVRPGTYDVPRKLVLRFLESYHGGRIIPIVREGRPVGTSAPWR